jgi:hypothetical protein
MSVSGIDLHVAHAVEVVGRDRAPEIGGGCCR